MTDISKLIEIGYAKPIENLEYTKGFKGYWVLKNGKIWSEPRAGSKGGFLKAQKSGPTKKDTNKKEYLFVKLFNSSKSRSKKVHIIVAEAFIGPRPIGANGRPLDTDHIDHDQFNNHYKNLQYLTRRENIQRSNLNKKNKSSSYLGVFKKANNKFISKIFVDGYRKQIGTFNEEIEAAKAYDLKCYELFGEQTILNFPEFKEEYKKIIKLQKENPQQRELDFNGQENEK